MPCIPGTNTGHGHVWPRPDGIKARCGGPGLCSVCSHHLANKAAIEKAVCKDGKPHDWGKWRDCDMHAEPPTFVRRCDRCGERQITDDEPAYVKRL